MRKQCLKNIKKLVIKIGTSVLSKDKKFSPAILEGLVEQIIPILKNGTEVSIVSSGAIGAGMTILKIKTRPTEIQALQGAAAVGQRYLMECYQESFGQKGFNTAQMLLTWDDMAQDNRRLNTKHTLKQIQKWGVVPIVNENDTVATDEIRFGDNDRLSSMLAILVEANALIILSDTDGLYERGKASKGQRISLVEKMDDKIFSHVQDQTSALTVGGMRAKLSAIADCTAAGIPVFLAAGQMERVLQRILDGEDIGTLFTPKKIKSHKSWATFLVKNVNTGRRINFEDRRKGNDRRRANPDRRLKSAQKRKP